MTKRDSFPDALRGFALIGIVLVNAPYLAINTVLGLGGADVSNVWNSVPVFFITSLALGKFYLLFSFLFGYSAAYILKSDKANMKRWLARALLLIFFGALHAVFLWHGDILFMYGLLAIPLVALYFRCEKTIRRWVKIIYIANAAVLSLLALLLFAGEMLGEDLGETVISSSLDSSLVAGSFLDNAGARFDLWFTGLPGSFALQAPFAFAAFLVGVLAARKRFLGDGADAVTMKKLAVWGFAIGLPLQLIAAWFSLVNQQSVNYSVGAELGWFTVTFVSAPVLSAGYLGALWLLMQRYKRGFGLLAAAGRHSLTVYIGQSVILVFVFSAWGLGLFGTLNLTLITLIAFGTWLLLAGLAVLNSRYFSSGPLEWVLKKTTEPFRAKA
ncbi:MAG: DUF418 domain-containing protein [Aquiluna sp.]|nr:DUF418 domain-containing protein [Aquiluna sp.]